MVAVTRAIPDSDLNARVRYDRAVADPRPAARRDYRAYALGDQLDPRTPAQRAMFPQLDVHAYADNVCKRVVATPANRLSIARFAVDGPDPAVAAIQEHIARASLLNHLPRLAAGINVATLRDGDHAVALRWVNGAPRYLPEPWWDGATGMFVAYDDDRLPVYAAKEWTERDGAGFRHRRVIWFPDRIERYASADRQGWEAINLPDDPYQGGQPVPWLTGDDEPIGLMVVHFANRLLPNDAAHATAPYGVSLLAGGVLGIQDRINLIHFDIVSTSSFTGSQMLWAKGVRPPLDPDGNVIPYAVVPGSFIADASPDAGFGVFPAGSIDAHDRALQIEKETIAQTTGLPYVVLAGNWPSGEALARAEGELAELVDKFGEIMGPDYASLLHKSTRLANIFGGADLDEALPIRAVFQPSQRSNPLVVAQQLALLAGVEGRREALRDGGKQPADLDRIMAEVAEDQQRAATATATAFNAGQL